jgi:inner membrane protein
LGACAGELIAGRAIGKKAMLFGALIGNIPDIDVICYAWMTPTEALLAHRGITHSIFVNLLLTFLLAYVLLKTFPRYALSFNRWIALIGANLFLHLFLDLFNAYGMGLLEPFSSARFSFNALFIIDPLFTVPLFIGSVALLFLRIGKPLRKKVATTALVLSSCYLASCGINKMIVDRITEKSISAAGNSTPDYFTSPTPFNNLLWYVVVKNEKEFFTGYYSVLDSESVVHFQKTVQNDSLLDPYRNSKDIQNLVRFSQGYYCVNVQDSAVVFSDLRFGQENGWKTNNASFNFHYNVQTDQKNPFLLQRGRTKSFTWESVSGIISRITQQSR